MPKLAQSKLFHDHRLPSDFKSRSFAGEQWKMHYTNLQKEKGLVVFPWTCDSL